MVDIEKAFDEKSYVDDVEITTKYFKLEKGLPLGGPISAYYFN